VAAIELDHVLIAVTDLAEAGNAFAARFGLVSLEGGRHPGWGTANRIVPLGSSYLELIAVVDESEAAHSAWGAGSQAAPRRTDDHSAGACGAPTSTWWRGESA
jgi:hypothetical protein